MNNLFLLLNNLYILAFLLLSYRFFRLSGGEIKPYWAFLLKIGAINARIVGESGEKS